jgi:DNA polymerase epsilon subunit 2
VLKPDQRILTPVESLRGNPGCKITFGLVYREQDAQVRRWVIEDLHKTLQLDLSGIETSDQILTDGSFVLAEGEMDGDFFRVSRLDRPPAVPRKTSLERDQVPRGVFGGSLTDEQLRTMEKFEPNDPEPEDDPPYVVLSEVHLDSARVLEKLEELFRGFEEDGAVVPKAYVFMGSFCSKPFMSTAEGVRSYKDNFERLKFNMRSLSKHVMAGTRFIFVPGPKDPGAQTLPRMPLPDYLTADIRKEIPNVIMATNPCRIRHFSRELVFFRHDVLRLLRKHEIVPLREPETGDTPSSHHVQNEMVRFLADQAHLAPLPLVESNVLWEFDHALRLYPLPDAIFVGGESQAFDKVYQDCKFCSVGPFHREALFYTYQPVRTELTDCEIADRAG